MIKKMDKLCLEFNIDAAAVAGELCHCKNNRRIVIDLGTTMVKAGFAGDDQPTSVFATDLALPACEAQKAILPMCDEVFPMQVEFTNQGELVNLNESKIEGILQHTFLKELRVNPSEHVTLISQSFLNHSKNREKLPQLLFEQFSCPGLSCCLSNVLSLYSSGRLTGIAMDIGADGSHCVPVFDGFAVPGHTMHSEIGGNFITQHLKDLLLRKGFPIHDNYVLEDIKRTMCSVAPDLFTALKETQEKNYHLPNGNIIQVGKEAFQCAEVLFNPNIAACITSSIPQTIRECIEKVGISRSREKTNILYKNIVVSGGSANFSNFRERMKNEMDRYVSPQVKANIIGGVNASTSAWIGGSVLGSCSGFLPVCITKEEYNEHGVNIVYRKGF